MRMLLLFLVFSLIIQNTCPYGMAAKAGFAAKDIHRCPLRKHSQTKTNSNNTAQQTVLQAGQTFVFTVGIAISAMPLSSSEGSGFFPEIDIYKNIFSEPLVKPPHLV